jgi:hypothetical protein
MLEYSVKHISEDPEKLVMLKGHRQWWDGCVSYFFRCGSDGYWNMMRSSASELELIIADD